MFGYVSIYKDELKIKDFNLWRSYYCGLCKSLGKKYNNLIRLGLNYDMTFLAVLIASLTEEVPDIERKRCFLHPINKRYVAISPKALSYACDVSVVLMLEKLKDDINDDKKTAAFFLKLPYIIPYRNARKNCCAEKIRENLKELYVLENEKCRNIDKTADCFARLMAEIISPEFIPADKRETARNLGYNLGRWIYILDALNDYEDDIRKNRYNPFETVDYEEVEFTLTYTLSQIADSWRKMNLYVNRDLIENIIFLGLRAKQEHIIRKHKAEAERK